MAGWVVIRRRLEAVSSRFKFGSNSVRQDGFFEGGRGTARARPDRRATRSQAPDDKKTKTWKLT